MKERYYKLISQLRKLNIQNFGIFAVMAVFHSFSVPTMVFCIAFPDYFDKSGVMSSLLGICTATAVISGVMFFRGYRLEKKLKEAEEAKKTEQETYTP